MAKKAKAAGTKWIMHRFPEPHVAHYLLDRDNFGRCMFPGCMETKQYPTVAEVMKNLSKQRNYKKGYFKI